MKYQETIEFAREKIENHLQASVDISDKELYVIGHIILTHYLKGKRQVPSV